MDYLKTKQNKTKKKSTQGPSGKDLPQDPPKRAMEQEERCSIMMIQ